MKAHIRVIVADDTLIVREGLKRLLESIGEVELLATASNPDEVLYMCQVLRPDVVILDMKWFDDENAGLMIVHQIKSQLPVVSVIAMSAYPYLLTDAQKAGADAAVSKGFSRSELVQTINRAAPTEHVKRIYEILLSERCALEDIEDICFRLGLDSDNLSGATKPQKARSLIRYFQQRNALESLVRVLEEARPDLNDRYVS